MLEEERSKHSVSRIAYHIVWIPKYRRRILVGPIREALIMALEEKAGELGWRIIALEVIPDHVHLFIQADKNTPPSRVVKLLKGYTSRILGLRFPWLRKRGHIWARGYWLSTIGNVSAETIQKYILAQRKGVR